MRNSKWVLAFIVPTIVSAVFFLFLLSDSLRQAPKRTNESMLTEEVINGKKVFQKYNCNDCHTFFGIGGYYAPDLTKIYKKYGDSGRKLLKDIILNPEKHFSGRKMKKFNNMTAAEAEKIIEYLRWTSEINNNDWPPAYSRAKNKNNSILSEKKCLICHQYKNKGGNLAPPLDNVKNKFKNREALREFIKNPQAINENSLMPPYGGAEFTEEEFGKIVEFLWEGKP